jgi:hypothetical protein
MDFKHLTISTGAVNVLSNTKKNKSQGNISHSGREKRDGYKFKRYGLFIAN